MGDSKLIIELLRRSRHEARGEPKRACCASCAVSGDGGRASRDTRTTALHERVTGCLGEQAQFLTARRTRGGVASVSSVPIGEAEYGGIVQQRIAALGASAKLNERELRVLQLLMTDATLAEVAVATGLSESTVKRTQRRVLRQLGAESRFDLPRLLFV